SHRRLNIWLVWQHKQEEHQLDRLSEEGVHLEKPGFLFSTFRTDPEVRYVYRLDYQPALRAQAAVADYRALFEDAGWEYMGRWAGWYYFRKSWVPQGVVDVYTDRQSIRNLYRRIQRMIGVVLLIELFLVAYEVGFMPAVFPHVWHWAWPFWVLWAGLLMALGYGFLKIHQRTKDSP
nr:DUF2812 domain-containing protein [Thermaerobacter sp.]